MPQRPQCAVRVPVERRREEAQHDLGPLCIFLKTPWNMREFVCTCTIVALPTRHSNHFHTERTPLPRLALPF